MLAARHPRASLRRRSAPPSRSSRFSATESKLFQLAIAIRAVFIYFPLDISPPDLYAAQYGKCAVLGVVLDIDDIHCHHKLPKKLGGKDNYQNLIIIHQDVHRLLHATQAETISRYLHTLKLDKQQISKINKIRKMVGNEPIK